MYINYSEYTGVMQKFPGVNDRKKIHNRQKNPLIHRESAGYTMKYK